MSEKKVILLTGATGYLGSNILPNLIQKGYQVIILKRSFSNISRIQSLLPQVQSYDIDMVDLKQIFEKHDIDIIMHCATHYGRKDKSPLHILEANLLLPLRLLELAREHNVSCFINTDTILDKRINSYSLSKKQFKEWLMNYKQDLTCINIALEHFYGPYDDDTKFVSYIIRSLLTEVDHIDITKGEQKRDFVFIDDVVNAFLTVLDNAHTMIKGFYYFEIGSNRAMSIRELVEMIKEKSGNTSTELHFGALPYRENEVMECVADTTEIKKLGWSCAYSLEEGIEKTIQGERVTQTHI